jgi:hypothetical protein
MKDKPNMLQSLVKAIALNPAYKQEARADEYFKSFWDNADFKKLVE